MKRPNDKIMAVIYGSLGGRKVQFDPEEWKPVIVEWLDNGRMMSELVREPDTPSRRLIAKWRKADEEFDKECDEAFDAGLDTMAEDVILIADCRDQDASPFAETRTRVDARIRMLSRWSHRFAEKRQVENTGNGNVQIITGVPARDEPETPTRQDDEDLLA